MTLWPHIIVAAALWLVQGVAGQACGPITAAFPIASGQSSTVRSQESASGTRGATAVVLACGQVSLGPQGTATLSGGTATISGAAFFDQAYATVATSTTGYIATATEGSVDILQGATASGGTWTNIQASVASGALLDVKNGNDINLSGEGTISATGTGVYAYGFAAGAKLYVTGSNVGANAYTSGVTAIAYGTDAGAGAADGGVATMSGSGGMCSVGRMCTMLGQQQVLYCESGGTAVVYGLSNSLDLGRECTAIVSGEGNAVTDMASLARATMVKVQQANVADGAAAYVYSDALGVVVQDGGSATLDNGAKVTAAPNARLFAAGPGIQYTSSADAGEGYTIYEARNVGTLRRRAALPAPTGRCDVGKTTCPDLRGGFKCVDTNTDIFNCGGCNFGLDSVRVGVDCTTLFDGNVQCFQGRCVV